MNKRLLPFLLGCIFFLHGYSSHITVSGDVTGIWDADTVFVAGNIQLSSGNILNIAPGTLVRFLGHYRFRVDGQLLALGLINDSIRFTINDTTGFSGFGTGAGSWKGIWFNHLGPAIDSTIFEYCRFEYGKAAFDPDSANWYGGAVCAREANRLRFSYCSFINNRAYKNGGGIYARLSDIKVDHCLFENNFCGQATTHYGYGGGICLEYSDALIHRNYFTKNSSTGVGGGLSWEYSDPSVSANHFYDNYSALGGGFTSLRSEGLRPVVNNLVEANSSLFFGGGIAVLQTTAPFLNNTFVANYSGAGGGLYFNASSFAVFKNCVIWDNYDFGGEGPQVYIWDTFSAPEFYYCVVEGGVEQFGGTGGGSGFIGVYQNCFETNPDFTGSGSHPYQPMQNSVCINNGTPDTTGLSLPARDFAENERIMNSRIDIGAYETMVITAGKEVPEHALQAAVYPNPFHSVVTVEFFLDDREPVQIFLLDEAGRTAHQLMNTVLSPGHQRFEFDPEQVTGEVRGNGVYFLEIRSGSSSVSHKLIQRKGLR